MQIAFTSTAPSAPAILALPIDKDAVGRGQWGGLGEAHRAIADAAAKAARFDGEAGAIVELFVADDGQAKQLLLVGVGSGDEAGWSKAGGALVARLLTSGATELVADLNGADATPQAAARFAAAAAQRAWRYDHYRTKLTDKQKVSLTTLTIAGAPDGTDAAWAAQDAVTQGLELTRNLVAAPPNILYPETFVDQVRESVEGLGLEIVVLGEDEMREHGMGALLGVSQGSVRDARILALKWNGAGEGDPTLALVGKGVTFDTGGISLKPGAGMEDMKWDMGGAAAVTGTMIALASRKAKANVIGVLGLVENMPDGNAQRPGDVVVSMSGQTVEVINTDAEGRLVLADALWYTQERFKPKFMIDLATLTGAMIVALGLDYAGVFSNSDDVADPILSAAKKVGENFWRMPIPAIYEQHIDSKIADVKNTGNGRAGGSITAALFLQRFTNGVPWAHLDIAPTAWANKSPSPTVPEGGVGFAVRTLDRMVADTYEA